MAYLAQFTFSCVMALFLCKISLFCHFYYIFRSEDTFKKPSDRESDQKLVVSSVKIEVK